MKEIAKKSSYSLAPTNFEEAMKLASMIAQSDFAPQSMRNKPNEVLIAIQMGNEAGLNPMQAIQNIAVINGKPSMYGDALLALVQSHHAFEWIKEEDSGECATCIVKRKGAEPHTVTFSNADAQKAGLLNRKGPWQQYPKRMRQMRARGFALRDQFADALMGFNSAEEVSDYDVEPKFVNKAPPKVHKVPKVKIVDSEVIEAEIIEEEDIPMFDDKPSENEMESFKNSLESCESVEELKAIWLSMSPELQKEMEEVKNSAKLRLTEKTDV